MFFDSLTLSTPEDLESVALSFSPRGIGFDCQLITLGRHKILHRLPARFQMHRFVGNIENWAPTYLLDMLLNSKLIGNEMMSEVHNLDLLNETFFILLYSLRCP